ncbi:helix-turn-helix domain-containing protein (plasmid) [Alicyclobacillus fastidiosus]|uniref:Helix-turn-helix domain-containing protein n=1 Tax=Alicyclobacillus fastidiosus TaxID=392011 RepID=A0ABY6ZQC1_9BACL|nr:helix-turn-helix domain-containing protein [Alicyclobacillus fastidiosus]WAH44808.1 helix-turn-helix domain-containing protein [Alicyclobacillus fastidiosus]
MSDELLSFKQAAELLQLSEKTLIKILAEQDIPARKIGNKWIFSKEALIRWVSEGSSKDYTKSGVASGDEESE